MWLSSFHIFLDNKQMTFNPLSSWNDSFKNNDIAVSSFSSICVFLEITGKWIVFKKILNKYSCWKHCIPVFG